MKSCATLLKHVDGRQELRYGGYMDGKIFEDILYSYGQIKFAGIYRGLPEEARRRICEQAELMDFTMLKGASKTEQAKPRGVISPIRTLTIDEYAGDADRYREIGLEAISKGRVAALILAGGKGTRLGFDHAKGIYDIGITHELYIFECQFSNILDVVREAGTYIHVFIMVNYESEQEVRNFFEVHSYFGYDPEYVHFYSQDMSPCLDDNGDMFLEAPARMAMSPNGNGGFYSSLVNAGLDSVIRDAGIEFINVFAVDNVLQRIADPVFTGALIASGMSTGAKVVRKCSPDERVGAICLEDGTPSVVEYYEMTEELKAARLADGSPAYNYGVILNYMFRIADIADIVSSRLPVHMVRKKVPYLGYADGTPYGNRSAGTGTSQLNMSAADVRTHEPASPNAYKLETLALDLVHLTDSALSFEVEREREFAPIKNADGVDSVVTARELLKKNGVVL